MSEKRLILLDESLLTESLLDISPILIDRLHLLSSLRVCTLLSLVLSQELLQSINVETSCLTVYKRCRKKHLVSTLAKDVLHLLVCYGKTKLFALVSDNLVLNHSLPNAITKLRELSFIKVVLTLKLHSLRNFIHELREIHHIDFLAQHFAYLLSLFVLSRFTRTEELFGNECKKAKSDNAYQNHAFASNFS